MTTVVFLDVPHQTKICLKIPFLILFLFFVSFEKSIEQISLREGYKDKHIVVEQAL